MTTILSDPEPNAPPCNSCEGPMTYKFSDVLNTGGWAARDAQPKRPASFTHWFWCEACQQMWRLTPDGGLLRDHHTRQP